MNTTLPPQVNTTAKLIRAPKNQSKVRYLKAINDLRATLADGNWHRISTTEFGHVHNVSVGLLSLLVKKEIIESRGGKNERAFRRTPKLDRLTPEVCLELVKGATKESREKKKSPGIVFHIPEDGTMSPLAVNRSSVTLVEAEKSPAPIRVEMSQVVGGKRTTVRIEIEGGGNPGDFRRLLEQACDLLLNP